MVNSITYEIVHIKRYDSKLENLKKEGYSIFVYEKSTSEMPTSDPEELREVPNLEQLAKNFVKCGDVAHLTDKDVICTTDRLRTKFKDEDVIFISPVNEEGIKHFLSGYIEEILSQSCVP